MWRTVTGPGQSRSSPAYAHVSSSEEVDNAMDIISNKYIRERLADSRGRSPRSWLGRGSGIRISEDSAVPGTMLQSALQEVESARDQVGVPPDLLENLDGVEVAVTQHQQHALPS